MAREEVKVTHGCACASAVGFLLIIGLIALIAEDIGENPGTWIPVLVIGGLLAVAVVAYLIYQDQQREQQADQGQAPPGTAESRQTRFDDVLPGQGADEKQCPDCAESVKAAARVCRFCGYRFDQ